MYREFWPNNKPASISVNAWHSEASSVYGQIINGDDRFPSKHSSRSSNSFSVTDISFLSLRISKWKSGFKSRLILDSQHILSLSQSLSSRSRFIRYLRIIFVLLLSYPFRHDHKSSLTTWKKKKKKEEEGEEGGIYPPRKQSTLGIDSKRALRYR